MKIMQMEVVSHLTPIDEYEYSVQYAANDQILGCRFFKLCENSFNYLSCCSCCFGLVPSFVSCKLMLHVTRGVKFL